MGSTQPCQEHSTSDPNPARSLDAENEWMGISAKENRRSYHRRHSNHRFVWFAERVTRGGERPVGQTCGYRKAIGPYRSVLLISLPSGIELIGFTHRCSGLPDAELPY